MTAAARRAGWEVCSAVLEMRLSWVLPCQHFGARPGQGARWELAGGGALDPPRPGSSPAGNAIAEI